MKNEKFKNIIIGILIIIIVLLIVLICLIYNKKSDNDNKKVDINSNNEVIEQNNKLSETEAITIGKSLYDKATEIYEVWVLRPYCGFNNEEIYKQPMTNFGINEFIQQYDSGMKNLDELKDYLAQYLSDTIINEKIKENAITDLSKVEQYSNYVETDGKLYCRANTGKGWLNNSYLNEYKMEVQSITENKIIYNIKSTYINSNLYVDNPNSECSIENSNKCSDSDKEYKDTKFIVEKNSNNKWIISEYTLHE